MDSLSIDVLLWRVYFKYGKLRKPWLNRERRVGTTHYNTLRRKLVVEYYCLGYSINHLTEELNIPGTTLRTIFDFLGIERRPEGHCNHRTSEKRRENAIRLWKSKSGMFKNHIGNNRTSGCQGYFWNSSQKKFVWLRSSYEYIFAKYLERNGLCWGVEERTYTLKNGQQYRPDFFIYSKNFKKLERIVEIKGWDSGNHKKPHILSEELFDVSVEVYYDMTPFMRPGSTYRSELLEWKRVKKNPYKEGPVQLELPL